MTNWKKMVDDSHGADSKQIAGTHYKEVSIQPWAAMESWMSQEEFVGFLRSEEHTSELQSH